MPEPLYACFYMFITREIMTAISAKKSRTQFHIMSGVDVARNTWCRGKELGIQQPVGRKTLQIEWKDDKKRWKMIQNLTGLMEEFPCGLKGILILLQSLQLRQIIVPMGGSLNPWI